MRKMRNWMVGLTIVSLLAVGLAAVAGNGFGEGMSRNSAEAAAGDCDLHERDADGDGTANLEDSEWVCPQDGTGYGAREGCGLNQLGDRPLDGSGSRAGHRGGMGHRSAGGLLCGGSS
jgi:hypothetical protein